MPFDRPVANVTGAGGAIGSATVARLRSSYATGSAHSVDGAKVAG